MLNSVYLYNIQYNNASTPMPISFGGHLCQKTWQNHQAKKMVTEALKEYFAGIDSSIFKQFINIIDVNAIRGEECWDKLKEFLRSNPFILKKIRENANIISAERVKFLRKEFFKPLGDNFKGRSLLDIGSCDGKVTIDLAESLGIKDITGVEVHRMPEHKDLDFETIIYDGKNLGSHVNRKYDIVSMISTLHHSHHPKDLLQQAHSVLNDNGYLILVEHPTKNEADKLFHYFMDTFEYVIIGGNNKFQIPNHLKTSAEWIKLMEESGFKVVKIIEPKVENPFRRVEYVLQKIPTAKMNSAYRANNILV